jgi:hypothetical protein
MTFLFPSAEFLSSSIPLSVIVTFFFLCTCAGSANAAAESGAVTIALEREPVNGDFYDATASRVGQVAMTHIVAPKAGHRSGQKCKRSERA